MQVCTSLQTDNHASTPLLSFLQAGCPSCRPTNSVKALKAKKLIKKLKEIVHTSKVSHHMLFQAYKMSVTDSTNDTHKGYISYDYYRHTDTT